eukprot:scaffold3687_cov66-Cylindrotheca_fusiformis.AAC.1
MSSDCDQTITVSHHISLVVVCRVTLLRRCTVLSRTAASPNASSTSGMMRLPSNFGGIRHQCPHIFEISRAPSHTTTNHGAGLAGTNRTTDSERRQLAIFDRWRERASLARLEQFVGADFEKKQRKQQACTVRAVICTQNETLNDLHIFKNNTKYVVRGVFKM